jgi:hypothetical protein
MHIVIGADQAGQALVHTWVRFSNSLHGGSSLRQVMTRGDPLADATNGYTFG